MILAYWETVGGTLCEEYQVVPKSTTSARRCVDAIIVPYGPKVRLDRAARRHFSVVNHDVIVVQAKANRLGMYLMGQGVFSAELVKSLGARSVKSVVLCKQDDEVLRPLFERYPRHEVVVMAQEAKMRRTSRS